MTDELCISDLRLKSRFMLGSGKTSDYSPELIKAAVEVAGVEMISVAIAKLETEDSPAKYIPDRVHILPNTLGARDADSAVDMVHWAYDKGFGKIVKLEIMSDSKYFLPDPAETKKATSILAAEGFTVIPYMYPEIVTARELYKAGAAALMPLASPSGSNKGLQTKDFIQVLIKEIELPIIVDAGIGMPSQACEAMEMGCAAVMAKTGLSTAGDLKLMADSFKKAIEAGRTAYLSCHPKKLKDINIDIA